MKKYYYNCLTYIFIIILFTFNLVSNENIFIFISNNDCSKCNLSINTLISKIDENILENINISVFIDSNREIDTLILKKVFYWESKKQFIPKIKSDSVKKSLGVSSDKNILFLNENYKLLDSLNSLELENHKYFLDKIYSSLKNN